jgi:hypothetical protein
MRIIVWTRRLRDRVLLRRRLRQTARAIQMCERQASRALVLRRLSTLPREFAA